MFWSENTFQRIAWFHGHHYAQCLEQFQMYNLLLFGFGVRLYIAWLYRQRLSVFFQPPWYVPCFAVILFGSVLRGFVIINA